jgi:heptosyltransferase-1
MTRWPASIAVVRLSAMGDILHTLPAVARLKRTFPETRITWVVAPKWIPLLEGNPTVDEVVPFDRRRWSQLPRNIAALRRIRPQIAIDFQGLIQSAVVARLTGPSHLIGLARDAAREPLATTFYHQLVSPQSTHIVDHNLELAAAAGAALLQPRPDRQGGTAKGSRERSGLGADGPVEFPIPTGTPEGNLPYEPFVLASPFAGWVSKQWPVEHYAKLAELLREKRVPLVLNVAPQQAAQLTGLPHVEVHTSSLAGLIDATRRATAVIGLDSGPLHLAAALGKPGVGLYGPTDPERNGPYGGSIYVLRMPGTATTWKRTSEIHPAMRALTPERVFDALFAAVDARHLAEHGGPA